MFGRVVHWLASKKLCPCWEFLVQFQLSSEVVELSEFKKNKHTHRRCRSYTLATLEMTANMFCELRWIEEHTLSTQVFHKDKVTRRTMR
jgi:hypothetical protein